MPPENPDEIDWSLTTFEGLRQRQREEFRALSFREKLIRVEQMNDVAAQFAPKPAGDASHTASDGSGQRASATSPTSRKKSE